MANAARRWIEFFDEFLLVDPETREPVITEKNETIKITNAEFMTKIMGNPLWSEGYAQGKAQDNIMAAFDRAQFDREKGYWVLEDDWKFLKVAAETPRFLFLKNGMAIIQTGFGYHPSMSRQFVRAQASVIEAKTEADKEKFDAELAKMRAAQAPVQASA